MRRLDVRAILRDPVLRKRLMVQSLITIQAREGRDLAIEEAEAVYDRVQSSERWRATRGRRCGRRSGRA